MEKYRFLENITVADVAFEAFGKDLNELFCNAGLAMTEVMVDPKTLSAKIEKIVDVEGQTVEKALYEFLEELIFLKDTDSLLFKTFQIIVKEGKAISVHAILKGELIDPVKHTLDNDAKAITWHEFKAEKIKNGWRAQVIVDI